MMTSKRNSLPLSPREREGGLCLVSTTVYCCCLITLFLCALMCHGTSVGWNLNVEAFSNPASSQIIETETYRFIQHALSTITEQILIILCGTYLVPSQMSQVTYITCSAVTLCHYGELPGQLLLMPHLMVTMFFFLYLEALLFLDPHLPHQNLLLLGSSLWGPWLGSEVQPSSLHCPVIG